MDTGRRLDVIVGLLTRPRYEVIPLDGVDEAIVDHVPKELKLTVTASPRRGIESTLLLTEQLAKQGFPVVPHIAARLLVDEAHLGEILHRLDDLDVREIFVVAGDRTEPIGQFRDSVALLSAIARSDHRLAAIGIAGYPEGHPFIGAETLMETMARKEQLSSYVVSQISFDAETIASWVRIERLRGLTLPIHIGLPGAVDRHKLLRISMKIGVGDSARFLAKHGTWLARMLLPGDYSSESLIEGLGSQLADPANDMRGLHIYTFNEVERTETWRRTMIERFEALRSRADAAGA